MNFYLILLIAFASLITILYCFLGYITKKVQAMENFKHYFKEYSYYYPSREETIVLKKRGCISYNLSI